MFLELQMKRMQEVFLESMSLTVSDQRVRHTVYSSLGIRKQDHKAAAHLYKEYIPQNVIEERIHYFRSLSPIEREKKLQETIQRYIQRSVGER